MNIIRFLLTGLFGFFSLLLITNVAYAEDSVTGDVVYANGGIGIDNADEMRAKAGEYNLRLYMSEGKLGHFISDVQISITDKHGLALDLPNSGPMLFLKMKKGSYKVTAKYNDVTINRNVTISS